ncbi:MAG: YihA family ribosome biogenesis GTP-binding protein [Betaproteobacteria bacterium]|nr:YihA family ribosome biogenesis GTP-binding protein [Betaproteobacteria bacterium]NCA16131.1 YihA family ribosome biogenesis GTP-binding protein [Betaproteobacteria bacterium]
MASSEPPSSASPPPAQPPDLDRWIAQVEFLQSGAKLSDLPPPTVPEIAIAGRSNAGKSTALNVLCNRRRLAFASKTPGRTRLINLFSLIWREQEVGRLVDLPGYGYAQVDLATRRQWGEQLSRYLSKRSSLVGLILVTDIRHALGELDQQMLEWFGLRERPVHILLTKSDKLTRQEQTKAVQKAHAQVLVAGGEWGPAVSLSLFSGLKKTGREPVLERISDWLDLPGPGEAGDTLDGTTPLLAKEK